MSGGFDLHAPARLHPRSLLVCPASLPLDNSAKETPLKGLRGQGCADAVSWTGKQTQGQRSRERERNPGSHREITQGHGHRHTHPIASTTTPTPPHTHKHTNPTLTSTEMEGADPIAERTGAAREGKPDGNTENKMLCRHFGALNQLFSREHDFASCRGRGGLRQCLETLLRVTAQQSGFCCRPVHGPYDMRDSPHTKGLVVPKYQSCQSEDPCAQERTPYPRCPCSHSGQVRAGPQPSTPV